MSRTVDPRTLLLTTLLIALILAAADLFVVTAGALLLVFAGVLFGVFVNGLAGWLARHTPIAYRYTYLLVVALLLALIGIGFFYLGAQIAQRTDQLLSQLQTAVESATEKLRQYEVTKEYLPDASQLQTMATEQGSSAVSGVLSGMRAVGWAVTGAFIIFFVGLYAAYDPELYRTGLLKLAPIERRDRIAEVLDELRSALGHWIIGRLMSMTVVGVLTAIGLSLFGIPLPITLGVVAALLTFIPNIGPLLAAVPQVLLALNVGTSTAMYVILFNIALQGVESYLITPMIQRHEVSLPPILTIAAQLLLGVLVGVVGVMTAAPLVVVLTVMVQMLYIHDRLGDPDPGELTA